MKKSLSLLLILVLAFSLISCNNSDNVNTKVANEATNEVTNNVTNKATNVDVIVDSSTVYPLEITDSKGRIVTIVSEPERIVFFSSKYY